MKAPFRLALLVGFAIGLGLSYFSPRFRGWCRRVLQWVGLLPRLRAATPAQPATTATIAAIVEPGERVELDWLPDELVLWVGLQTAVDVREGERWPRPPDVVGLQLDGRELLLGGGLVAGMPSTLRPGCRVRVTLQSRDSIPVAVNLHFHYRRFGLPLPVAELGTPIGAPITNLGA